jgi:putative ABC transport system permease protein
MNWIALAWRQLRRDLAAGDVRILLAALVLAVMAVTSVSFITDRAERALALEANRLLGGDAVVRADSPIEGALREAAAAPGLQQTETLSFPSMVRAGEALRLGEMKAMGEGFPLRGRFLLLDPATGGERAADGIPAPGTLWLSRAGSDLLGAEVGDAIGVGNIELTLAALVVQEPDAALDYFNTAPRVFLNLADVPATGLVQEGSRIGYRLVVAGEAAAVEGFTTFARDNLGRGQKSAARWIAPTASWVWLRGFPWCSRPSPWRWPRAGTAPGICRARP